MIYDKMSTVKKYKVLQPVMVSFLTARNQIDEMLHPDDGDFWLESDGHTIWALNSSNRLETITMANAINIWLEQGKIEEV